MTDLISRQAAIKAIDDLPNCYNGYSDTYDKACIIGVLEELPSAEKKGKWKEIDLIGYKAICSECGVWSPVMGNYCPNCGAMMERSKE